MKHRRTLRKSGTLLAALVMSTSIQSITASSASAVGTCTFTSTLCMWDQAGFVGATLSATPLPPNQSACVDLVQHGWGNRVKSAINTSSGTASLFESNNCSGRPYPIEGNSKKSSIEFGTNSVFVQR